MINHEEYEKFTKDLEQFCLDRGYEIAGGCESEGIYGEIEVMSLADQDVNNPYLKQWKNNTFNVDWDGRYEFKNARGDYDLPKD